MFLARTRGLSLFAAMPLLALLVALPGAARAQSIAPGLWQIAVQTQVPGTGFQMPPAQIEHCLSESDAKDPSHMLGSVSSPDASSCEYTDKRFTGAAFHFAMICRGNLALQATGDVTFTALSLSGSIDAIATLNGQPVALKNLVTAQRIGDCHADAH